VTTPRRGQGFLPGERIRQGKEFQRAYQEGRRLVCRFFVAFVIPNRSGPLRLGVVASRRVGGAVTRNRAKRLLREVFRRGRPSREVSADVVLVARGPIGRARYQDVEGEYIRYLGKLLEKIP
jgi:ribonuclease P protein component